MSFPHFSAFCSSLDRQRAKTSNVALTPADYAELAGRQNLSRERELVDAGGYTGRRVWTDIDIDRQLLAPRAVTMVTADPDARDRLRNALAAGGYGAALGGLAGGILGNEVGRFGKGLGIGAAIGGLGLGALGGVFGRRKEQEYDGTDLNQAIALYENAQ